MAVGLGYTNWNGSQSGTANITSTASTSGATQATDSTFIALVSNLNSDIPTLADNKGNTWLRASTADIFGVQATGLYYCINGAGGAGHIVTASWTNGVTLASIGFSEFTGVGAGSLIATPAAFFNDTGNSPTAAPSITPQVGDLVVNGFGEYSGGAFVITSGGAPFSLAVEYETGTFQCGSITYAVAVAASAIFDTFSYNAFGYSAALSLSVRPAGTGDTLMGQAWM